MKRRLISFTVLTTLVAVFSASTLTLAGSGHQHLDPAGRDDGRPFSHAVLAGQTLYLSGGLGLDPETGAPPADVADEVRLLLDGMKAKLALADMTMDDLVSVQVFCDDIALYGAFNAIYATYFKDVYPARAFIGSGPLLFGAHFEIQGIAVRQNPAKRATD